MFETCPNYFEWCLAIIPGLGAAYLTIFLIVPEFRRPFRHFRIESQADFFQCSLAT